MGELIPLTESDRWSEALARTERFDCYHTAAYSRLCCAGKSSEAQLYVYENNNDYVVLPLVLNAPQDFPWGAKNVVDATSVYGYPGPLLGRDTQSSDALSEALLNDLRVTLVSKKVVALFARLHPLLTPKGLLAGSEHFIGKTVWLKLQDSIDEQRQQCRKSHRYELRKAWRNGVNAWHDDDFANIEQFISIYEQRMTRLQASGSYYFPREYYRCLIDDLGDKVKLVHAKLGDKIIGSSFFLLSTEGIQYHLSGTLEGYEKYSPTRVILEEMREWGTANGYRWLHLGGGVNGAEDNLFRFKSGFSTNLSDYRVGKIIVDEERYRELCLQRNEAIDSPAGKDFFPAYRA